MVDPPMQFHRLVRPVARRGGDATGGARPGRPYALNRACR